MTVLKICHRLKVLVYRFIITNHGLFLFVCFNLLSGGCSLCEFGYAITSIRITYKSAMIKSDRRDICVCSV